MNYTSLLEQAKQYVARFYKAHEEGKYIYHNLEHTEGVVAFAAKLARHYELNELDFFIVSVAAWFHDTGYCTGEPYGHEQRGAELAAALLKEKGVDEETITQVYQCILATRMPQNPTNLLEQIVCDADLSHLGTEEFNKKSKQLRKEMEETSGKKISKADWRKSSIPFLENYRYHTDYAGQLLNEGKQKNLDKIKEKVGEGEDENVLPVAEKALPLLSQKLVVPEEKSKKKKSERPDRGIETMFRISSTNHQRLSDMADNKASIMITTTSIIISVLLSVLLRKLEENRYLTVPVIMLLTVCVVTMVFAILATRPSIPKGVFTPKDIESKKVNLLFFGNFYRMNLEEYDNGMKEMMNDRDFLYGSLIRDVYSQGVVLGRKYNLLRIGYNVFMFGVVASVLAFVVATIFWGK